MKPAISAPVAVMGLLGPLVSAALVFTGQLSLDAAKTWMLAATAVWFAAAPFWLLSGGTTQGE